MFNKRKFKILVEQSLSNSINEVIDENYKLNLLEILLSLSVQLN